MHIITELYEVDACQSVLREDFTHNQRGWEIIDIETEKSEILNGYYYMHNRSKTDWNYYKMKSGLKKNQDFVVEALIELDKSHVHQGHFGLVWGFNDQHDYLNRFTISADGKRVLVMHFEKNHQKVYHRFLHSKGPTINTRRPVQLAIIKLGDYFHFWVNHQQVYVAHASFFAQQGTHVGYYIEPGLAIRSNYIEVKTIKARSLVVVTGLEQLMVEE
jgi:hypothetical protein